MRILHTRHSDDLNRVPGDTPDPTEAEIREALSGNICRCTGYQGIVDAAMDAAKKLNSSAG